MAELRQFRVNAVELNFVNLCQFGYFRIVFDLEKKKTFKIEMFGKRLNT